MGDATVRCPRCGSAMGRGYLPDVAHGVVMQAAWTPGDPVPRRFVGGIKWAPKESIAVTAYRCVKCGFLELFALSD